MDNFKFQIIALRPGSPSRARVMKSVVPRSGCCSAMLNQPEQVKLSLVWLASISKERCSCSLLNCYRALKAIKRGAVKLSTGGAVLVRFPAHHTEDSL